MKLLLITQSQKQKTNRQKYRQTDRHTNEAPRQQDRQCLLLPHPETAPDSPLCQQKSPETAGDVTRLIPLGLL